MTVRPIDANAMLSELRPVSFEAEHSAVLLSDVSKMMREWVERQPTLTPPNDPLTIEQLREMDGEPVYVHNLFPAKRKFEWQWALVCKERGNAEATTYTYRFLDYGKTWIAYRRPKEEQ